MTQKHRISTNIGKDQVIKVELKQDFDLLEVLSLKFTQKEIYTSLCADYGVVVGRISVNDGFGIPNARVSIFIPLDDVDENDPVISELYPYKSTSDRNETGYKYNLLPSRQQHSGHSPTGTFPDQTDVLNREEYLEIYEKYYKYTVKTNQSGDFMIWGVPLGTQTLHVDVDLSDMGCQSMVPYDFIYEGISEEKFENKYTFMSSENLDTLPQIISFDKTIEVYPFWGNEDLCEIGITRTDFDLGIRGVRLEPYAIMMGGTISDSGKDALMVNCNVDNQMGEKCKLTTFKGDIEAIRFTGEYEKDTNGNPQLNRPILESFAIDSTINENGVFFFRVPMNTEYYVTNEFGEAILSKQKKGIPTKGTYRFRFSLGEDTGARNRFTGEILVPNIREYHTGDTLFSGNHTTINPKSYSFSTNIDDYPNINVVSGTDNDAINDNLLGVPQDYFYQFRYNRVYTVSQFLNKYNKSSAFEKAFSFFVKDRNESFIGIKEISPGVGDCANTNNYFPINDAVRNHRFNFFIITIISFIELIGLRISLFIKEFVTTILFAIAELLSSTGVSNKAAAKMFKRAKEFQFKSIFKLSLIVYPDCYDCTEDTTRNEVVPVSDPIDIPSITGTTAAATNFYLEEKYSSSAGALGTCDEYTISNSGATNVTVTYTDCHGTLRTATITSGTTNFNLCAYPGQSSTFTSAGLDVSVTTDGCAGAGGYEPDDDLYFRSSGGGYAGFVPTPPVGQETNDGSWLRQKYVLEIDVYGGGSTYIAAGFGQGLSIVYDSATSGWKIIDLYKSIADQISQAYNIPFDEPASGTCHEVQNYVKVKKIWIADADVTELEYNLQEVESGCAKYDYIIEDALNKTGDMSLSGITSPIYSGPTPVAKNTYVDVIDYYESSQPRPSIFGGPHRPSSGTAAGKYMWTQLDPNYNNKVLGLPPYDVSDCESPYDYSSLIGVASIHAKWPTVLNTSSFENEVSHCIYNGLYYGSVKKKGPYFVDRQLTKDGTLTGFSEFRDGVYTIVPLAGKTGELLNSYRRRKLFGKLMCAGVTSYTFSNSWLNGMLYFFQFVKRGTNKFCKECLYKKTESDGSVHYYYRSTPYSASYSGYEPQTNGTTKPHDEDSVTGKTYNQIYSGKTSGFYGTARGLNVTAILALAGPNKEYLSSLGKVVGSVATKREIHFPTTVVDLGPRSTWIKEICFDAELDVNCSITRSIGSTTFKGIDDLMEYIIQSKEIKERGRLDVQDLFDKRGGGLIDGDVAQLLNFNTQVGIYPLETEDDESPYYTDYTDAFDFKGPIGVNFLYSEDNPETETIEANGYLVRTCLNKKGKLGDYSQKVPYFMWDTRGHGFGEDGDAGESQTYFTAMVYNQRFQQIKANTNKTTGDSLADEFQDGYVLPPIRDCIDTGSGPQKINDNYREYDVLSNTRHLMEIGGPFHFTFGLIKGETAFDKFIENFGPK
jgi:hypothetical protein